MLKIKFSTSVNPKNELSFIIPTPNTHVGAHTQKSAILDNLQNHCLIVASIKCCRSW